MARTNISVDQGVFNEFSAEAERQNKTLFAFANESLSLVAKVAAEGGNPADLYNVWRSTALLKQIDVITLPSDFVDELITRLCSDDKTATLKMFSDLGSRLVSVLKIAAGDIQDLSKLARDFGGLLPIKQLTFKAQPAKGDLEIDVVGAGRRLESTECAKEFLVSIVRGYGYSVTKQEVNVGTIRLWLTRRNPQ
jgi:hypothetical protein